jgi:hypothetical protein
MRRPEAWLLALITMYVMPLTEVYLFGRLLRGRPYIITATAMLLWGLLWPKLNDKKNYLKATGIITASIAASTYLHCSWYLFGIPVVCLLIARQWRAGAIFTISAVMGILIGASLTGHPFIFLAQTLRHAFLALGTHTTQAELVTELQAGFPSIYAVGAILLVLFWRKIRGSRNLEISRDPALIMIALCLIGGSITRRVWFDLGRPILCVWLALEFQEYFESIMEKISSKRVFLAIVLAVTLVIFVTSDTEMRWSKSQPAMVLSPGNAEIAPWLPEDGGIFYNDKYYLFYETFYKFPKANWRYILGFESGLMPPEDLAIFRNIQLSNESWASFEPWVKKMRSQDRLLIASAENNIPYITSLEWCNTRRGVWIGRLPKEK